MLTRLTMIASALAVSLPGTGTPPAPAPEPAAMRAGAPSYLPQDRLYFTTVDIDALMRAPVVDRDDRIVGSVAELMVGATGRITDAVVRLSGGTLGVTGKRVIVGFDEMKVEDRGDGIDGIFVLHADQSAERLRDRPYFKR